MTATVHASSYVDDHVEIGDNTKIWHFSHIISGTKIGKDCVIGQNVVIGPDVTVGNNCKIQNNVSLYKGVTLEDDVFCGPSCVFTNVNTPRSFVNRKSEFGDIVVRKGATIGANATIVTPCELGQYCFIAAGAVVTKMSLPMPLWRVFPPNASVGSAKQVRFWARTLFVHAQESNMSKLTVDYSRLSLSSSVSFGTDLPVFLCPTGIDNSNTHFETWQKIGDTRVYDRARKAPDSTQTADRIHMSAGEGLYIQPDQVIKAGDEVQFAVTLWGRGQAELSLQIYNFCAPNPPEMAELKIKVSESPTRHKLSHRFERDQACVRTQIILTSVDNFVQAWKPEYSVTKAPPPRIAKIPLREPKVSSETAKSSSSSKSAAPSQTKSSKNGAVSAVPDLTKTGIITPLSSD